MGFSWRCINVVLSRSFAENPICLMQYSLGLSGTGGESVVMIAMPSNMALSPDISTPIALMRQAINEDMYKKKEERGDDLTVLT